MASGLGMTSGVLQYGSEKRPEEEKRLFFKYGMNFGLVINVVLAVMILLYVKCIPIAIDGTELYIALMCFIPVVDYIFNYFCTILRCRKENKKYARILNTNTFFYFIFYV